MRTNPISRALTFIVLSLALSCLLQCGLKRPAVHSEKLSKPQIDHANFASSCVDCHEQTRPAPVYIEAHGGKLDCNTCHRYITEDPSWTALAQFSHKPAPTSCISCHGTLRPKPDHPAVGDCVACHAFPRFLPTIVPQ